MYLNQADLFYGLTMPFISKVMGIAERKSYPSGGLLLKAGEPATHFYILINGCVQLTLEETAQRVYIGCRSGETFGWSALVDRSVYTASAQCSETTNVLAIDTKKFLDLLACNEDENIIFYHNLAKCLAKRLVHCYQTMTE